MRLQSLDQIVLGLSSKHLQTGFHPILSNPSSLTDLLSLWYLSLTMSPLWPPPLAEKPSMAAPLSSESGVYHPLQLLFSWPLLSTLHCLEDVMFSVSPGPSHICRMLSLDYFSLSLQYPIPSIKLTLVHLSDLGLNDTLFLRPSFQVVPGLLGSQSTLHFFPWSTHHSWL